MTFFVTKCSQEFFGAVFVSLEILVFVKGGELHSIVSLLQKHEEQCQQQAGR